MLVDHFLDRFGAGHCRFLAEQRRARAKRKSGEVPDGAKKRRPHTPRRQQLFELLAVQLFLLLHMTEGFSRLRLAEHGKLTLVDTDSAGKKGREARREGE